MRTSKHIAKVTGFVFLLASTTAFAQLPSPYPICPSGANCNTPAPCGSGCLDSDNDGLCDSWEVMGGIDLNGDGRIDDDNDDNEDNDGVNDRHISRDDRQNNREDPRLPGADPYRPDIYLQYDWMVQRGRNGHSHRPNPKAIQAVVDAFGRNRVWLCTRFQAMRFRTIPW